MLFFGPSLSWSLLNLNQLRYFGVTIQDDFTRDEPFGITLSSLFIPFSLLGTCLHFSSRIPTNHKLETLPHLQMTSDLPWDPHTVQLRPRPPMAAVTASALASPVCHSHCPILASVSTVLSPSLTVVLPPYTQ